MRQLTRDPNAVARQREAEQRVNRESGITSVTTSQLNSGSSSAKKAPVFKSTLQAKNVAVVAAKSTDVESNREDEYDPERPTEYRDFDIIKIPRTTGPLGHGEWDDSEDEDAPRLKMVMY